MGVAVVLDGVAPMSHAGGDEEGDHQVCIAIRLGSFLAIQEFCDLLLIAVSFPFTMQQIGTYQFKGCKSGFLHGTIDIDVIICQKALESLPV